MSCGPPDLCLSVSEDKQVNGGGGGGNMIR